MSAVILIMLMSLGAIITGQMGKVALAERAREEIMGVVEGAEQVGVCQRNNLFNRADGSGRRDSFKLLGCYSGKEARMEDTDAKGRLLVPGSIQSAV